MPSSAHSRICTGRLDARLYVFLLTISAVAHCSYRASRRSDSVLRRSPTIKHGARRQAILKHPGFPTATSPRCATNGFSAEKLSIEQKDTLTSIHEDLIATRMLPERDNKISGGIAVSQTLDPDTLFWWDDLLDNMVQMAYKTDLFKDILFDTTTRIRQIVQDDTELLANLGSLNVTGRIKTPESITRKILFKANQRRKREPEASFEDAHINKVYDVVGLRLVIDATRLPHETQEQHENRSMSMCFRAKQLISQNWETLSFREKDYMKYPKSNGYQSLHLTAVVNYHLTKIPVEFQIRTEEMEMYANTGPAAHNRYKENFMDDLLSNSFPVNAPSEEKPKKTKKKRKRPRTKKPFPQPKSNRRSRPRERRGEEKLDYSDPAWLESTSATFAAPNVFFA